MFTLSGGNVDRKAVSIVNVNMFSTSSLPIMAVEFSTVSQNSKTSPMPMQFNLFLNFETLIRPSQT